MKIIHTSDWHLGKRLEGKSRLPEQEQMLGELEKVARNAGVDAIIVAGDVFDTVNPPAEAESLFYSACLSLSRICPVIAIAGNHDNPERLSAPCGIASECGILLGGSLNYKNVKEPFCGGEGFVSLKKGGERVNMALLPYPSLARMSQLGYLPQPEKSYSENVRDWLSLCSCGFTASDCNITVSHIFMSGSERANDEAELGTAALLPLDVLPNAHYSALGHVHKPQCVSKSRACYYSGSPLAYSFDDGGGKFFNLLNTSPASVRVEKIPIGSGRRLVTVTAKSFDECMEKLKENVGALVRVLYDSPVPLSSGKYAEMRGCENFVTLKNIYLVPKRVAAEKKTRTDAELFAEFYEAQFSEKPSSSMIALFNKAMNGEKI